MLVGMLANEVILQESSFRDFQAIVLSLEELLVEFMEDKCTAIIEGITMLLFP